MVPEQSILRAAGAPRLACRVRRDIDGRGALRVLAWPLAVVAAPVPAAAAALPVLGVARGPLGLDRARDRGRGGRPPRPGRRASGPATRDRGGPATRPLRRRGRPVRGHGPLVHVAAARLRRRAPLPADGAEPLARGRPRPARQPRARGLARVHAGPGPAALRRAPRADGRPFPAHSPGLPVLLAPVYAGGRAAPRAWSLLALAAAGVTVVAWRLAAQAVAGRESRRSWPGRPPWARRSPSMPSMSTPRCRRRWPSQGALLLLLGPASWRRRVGAALLASALPWLHVKMIAGRGRAGRDRGCAACAGAPLAAFCRRGRGMAAGYLAYYHAIFGTASPLAIYGGVPADAAAARPVRALVGSAARPLVRPAAARAGLPARAGRPPRGLARARRGRIAAARGGRPGARADVADVVGRAVPARALPRAARAAARRVRWPRGSTRVSGRGLARWRCASLRWGSASACSSAARPGELLLLNRGDRPTRLWAALSGDADSGATCRRW